MILESAATPLELSEGEDERECANQATNPEVRKDSRSLLVIDDDALFSAAVRQRLENSGATVKRAFDGAEGFEMARSVRPGAILLDLGISDGCGKRLLEQLRSTRDTATIPVVVLADQPDEKLQEQVIELGAERVLSRPVEFDALINELGGHLQRAQQSTDEVQQPSTPASTAC